MGWIWIGGDVGRTGRNRNRGSHNQDILCEKKNYFNKWKQEKETLKRKENIERW